MVLTQIGQLCSCDTFDISAVFEPFFINHKGTYRYENSIYREVHRSDYSRDTTETFLCSPWNLK